MNVTIRPWTLEDVVFSLTVRNEPALMRWFRQEKQIMIYEQQQFIEDDLLSGKYGGHVIEADGVKVGLCGVKDSCEFTLGLLPKYQGKGIATQAMRLLMDQKRVLWSEVFVGNPALEWFIAKLGFKVTGVRERAYYKKELGLVDVVTIKHD